MEAVHGSIWPDRETSSYHSIDLALAIAVIFLDRGKRGAIEVGRHRFLPAPKLVEIIDGNIFLSRLIPQGCVPEFWSNSQAADAKQVIEQVVTVTRIGLSRGSL